MTTAAATRDHHTDAAYRNAVRGEMEIEISRYIQSHWMAPPDAGRHAGRIADTIADVLYALMERRMPTGRTAPEMSGRDWSDLRAALFAAVAEHTLDPIEGITSGEECEANARLTATAPRTLYPLADIQYWTVGHGPNDSPFRLRQYHDSVEAVGGPFPLVPGVGVWGRSGSGTAYLVRTHHGHEVVVNAELLSEHPLCHWCGDPSSEALDERRACPSCREWAAKTAEERHAVMAAEMA